ncbi:MAG: hypothetical protein ACKO9Q_05835, partial [Pirellula sp.]
MLKSSDEFGAAELASPILKVHAMKLVPIPLDEQLATVAAIRRGMLGVVYIPNIDMLKTMRLGNRVGLKQFR